MQFDVVLVEDNEEDADLVFRVFQKSKLVDSALHFKTAETAYEYLINHHDTPRVVLLDLNLGGMSGLELLRSIRQNEKTRMLTTIVLTGCLPENMDVLHDTKFLLKPLDEHKLQSIVSVSS